MAMSCPPHHAYYPCHLLDLRGFVIWCGIIFSSLGSDGGTLGGGLFVLIGDGGVAAEYLALFLGLEMGENNGVVFSF